MVDFVPANVNNQGKPIVPPGGKPGYVLGKRGEAFGWWKSKTPVPPPQAPPPGGAPQGPARNLSGMSLEALFRLLRNSPGNRNAVSAEIKRRANSTRREVRYESATKRARKLGEFLRRLPRNFPGRLNITTNLLNTIRELRNRRELQNFVVNLGIVPNENIRRAIAEQRRRLEQRRANEGGYRRYNEGNNLARRRRALGGEAPPPPYYPGPAPRPSYNNTSEITRRRAMMAPAQPPPPYPMPTAPPSSNNTGEIARRRQALTPVEAPPPLPPNQQQAISNAGGINKAVNTIAQVPGGAPEVAKAAEALNETGGNAAQAVNIKGASPAAVRAVQNLGGARNTVNVLEGLNTLAQAPETRRRKRRTRRPKMTKPRVAELNRVIEAVKKQKLISLVAHNVTKTHNIHPNDEKLKKYYKKIIKASILRTPFASIVKKAAKKNK